MAIILLVSAVIARYISTTARQVKSNQNSKTVMDTLAVYSVFHGQKILDRLSLAQVIALSRLGMSMLAK